MDLALNVASFQEMNPPVIGEYFDDLRAAAAGRGLVFYCCNREEKRLPDGTVSRFAEYPWSGSDKILLDELCPWHTGILLGATSLLPCLRRPAPPSLGRDVELTASRPAPSEHAESVKEVRLLDGVSPWWRFQ